MAQRLASSAGHPSLHKLQKYSQQNTQRSSTEVSLTAGLHKLSCLTYHQKKVSREGVKDGLSRETLQLDAAGELAGSIPRPRAWVDTRLQ